jgi:hypothetical protein
MAEEQWLLLNLSACIPPGRFDNFQKTQYENVLIQRFLDSVLVK